MNIIIILSICRNVMVVYNGGLGANTPFYSVTISFPHILFYIPNNVLSFSLTDLNKPASDHAQINADP